MSSLKPFAADKSVLSLASIRETLIRLEDTIIFALIERARYAQNVACYDSKEQAYAGLTGSSGASLLDYMLLETERLHASVRRYTSPDEYAFFPHRLPSPVLPLIEFPRVLHPSVINLNGSIMDLYLTKVLPDLCASGDDGHHGSTVVADIAVLQAVSKRVHYGFFVAESKFQSQTAEFTRLIEEGDTDGIMALLTHAAVEEKILRRVRAKAATFGMEIDVPANAAAPAAAAAAATAAASAAAPDGSNKIDPELIVKLYRDHVIPLTKVAEVEYLQQRLSPAAIAYHGGVHGACGRATKIYTAAGKDKGVSLMPVGTAADVFEKVMSNKASAGVVVMEQGDSGILSAVRTLLRENPLVVVGEIVHETRFKLVARCEATQDVRTVVGRPEALRVCKDWVRKLIVQTVELEEAASADANYHPEALWGGGAAAAAAGAPAAPPPSPSTAYLVEAHAPIDAGMVVLSHAPPELVEVATCVVLTRQGGGLVSTEPSGRDKTLLYFGLKKDQAGTLADALGAFQAHSVNLLSIRSYANAADAGVVDFIAEIDGHEKETHLASAIGVLQGKAAVVRVLGSFAVPREGPASLVLAS